MRTEIAIYGKGGIGKSTISANLSAALARRGRSILQVGCDPKHDSTKLLLHGANIMTVLDYIRETSPDRCRLQDIVHTGAFGVHCVEAGGPEPGVGCAGRGILTTFELLDRLGIKSHPYDAIVYDVLGDVVCGGFAVPIRREYADKVYIVTSGEFMSLYAANNILRGLKNYDGDRGRAGGVILNSRGLGDEDERVRRFCEATGLPLLERFPRSELFSDSERDGMCLVERFPDSDLAAKFEHLAEFIYTQDKLYSARPLSDEELEERLLGKRNARIQSKKSTSAQPAPNAPASASKPAIYSKSLILNEPLHGCAFSGAMSICTQLADCICIAHGPNSCSHITYQSLTSVPRRFLLERGVVLPLQTCPPVVSSEMNEGVMIFGGIEELRRKIAEAKARKPKIIFILTTCPSGIIGDDIESVRDMEDGDTKIIPILTDGNLQGDYLQGILMAYTEIARSIIDPNVAPEENLVNIVAEKPETNAREESFRYVKEILDRFGIGVNCHFLCETSGDEIRGFKRAGLNLLAWGDYTGRTLKTFLQDEFGSEFLDGAFPIGFEESCRWVRALGERFGKGEMVAPILSEYEKRYRAEIAAIKPHLKGKRLMAVTYNHDIDWILQTAADLEMEIAFVGILNFSQDNLFRTDYRDRIGELHIEYDNERRHADIARIKPDILLTNYSSVDLDGDLLTDTIPLCPTAGFMSGVLMAARWSELFKMNLSEGWKQDDVLFRKYYS